MKLLFSLVSILVFLSGSPQKIQTPSVCISAEEMKLYSLIMEYRKSKNLKSIPLSAKLTLVAQTHTRDLNNEYQFDQNNKCNPHSWSAKGKWTACCYTADHKQAKCMWDKPTEIADYKSPGYEIAYYSSGGVNAQDGLDGWKLSPPHNEMITNSGIWKKVEWNAVGISLYKEYGVVWFGNLTDPTSPELCQQ
ncbi:MAG TPA: CAP domain-containing protein [Cyclobacteriaceae bacterium]